MCRGSTQSDLSGNQAGGQLAEKLLVRVVATQEEPDAACIAYDNSADLQELVADGSGLGIGQFGVLKINTAQGFEQCVSQTRQHQAELVAYPDQLAERGGSTTN